MRSDILDKSVHWKGINASYATKHQVARRHYLKKSCEHCGATEKLQMANISGKYLREASDWKTLCVKCHMRFDDQVGKLRRNAKVGVSGYRGVKPSRYGWFVRITIDYKEIYLGHYKDLETAIMVRLSAEVQLCPKT